MRILATALMATAAMAVSPASHAFGIGVRAGTTGIGGDIAWRVAPATSLRLGYSRLDWERDVTAGDVRYDGELKLRNLSGFVDFHPLGPFFRLTGGVVHTGDSAYDAQARATGGSFRLNGRTYSAADVGSFGGSVRPGRDFSPYLGIGYGNVSGTGINFYVDAGIIFQGSPRADLNASCGPALSAANCARLRRDVDAEEGRLEDELRRFRYYPVLNIGLTVGF